ncbi:MAG: hypothetical protein KC502_01860 [Myxococcales bacterium]|nr:hypothetical protein [Myxococcales bacterium]
MKAGTVGWLGAVALVAGLTGCLADARTNAQLDEEIAEEASGKMCAAVDVVVFKLGIATPLNKCLTSKDRPACKSPEDCVGECIDQLSLSTDCRICIDAKAAACIAKKCDKPCGLSKEAGACPTCAKTCTKCVNDSCGDDAQLCAPPKDK